MTPELPDERIVPATEAYPRAAGRGPDGVATEPTGSNNWAIAAERSTTGRALLASDPHLPFVHPSDFYEAHIAWPGHDVVGAHWAGVPGSPVRLQRRGRLGADQQRRLGARPLRRGGRRRRLPPRRRHGALPGPRGRDRRARAAAAPTRDPLDRRRPDRRTRPWRRSPRPAIRPSRCAGSGPSTSTTCARCSRSVARRDWPSFRAALGDWALPIFNWSYADERGAVDYQCAGRVPLRGRVVRGYRDPAEPADLWQGYVAFDALPRIDRPRRGYVHSANNRVAPDDHGAPLYGAWAGGNRATRIRELVDATERVSPERSREIQHDVFMHRAARAAPPMRGRWRPAATPTCAESAICWPPGITATTSTAPRRRPSRRSCTTWPSGSWPRGCRPGWSACCTAGASRWRRACSRASRSTGCPGARSRRRSWPPPGRRWPACAGGSARNRRLDVASRPRDRARPPVGGGRPGVRRGRQRRPRAGPGLVRHGAQRGRRVRAGLRGRLRRRVPPAGRLRRQPGRAGRQHLRPVGPARLAPFRRPARRTGWARATTRSRSTARPSRPRATGRVEIQPSLRPS